MGYPARVARGNDRGRRDDGAARLLRVLAGAAIACSWTVSVEAQSPLTGPDTGVDPSTSGAPDVSTVAAPAPESSDASAESRSDATTPSSSAEAPESSGRELDPSARPAPRYGSREAAERSEPRALRNAAQPDADDPDLPFAMSFAASVGPVMPSSYDDALQSHAFGPGSPNAIFDGSLAYALARWLHLGGRVGVRGRGWLRRDGDFAMTTGADLLGFAHARAHLGPVIDVGVIVGAGFGVTGLSIHRWTYFGLAPRLHGSLQLGFRFARGFRLFLRGGWDYFPWNDLDRGGHDIDLGGPLAGLGIEVRS